MKELLIGCGSRTIKDLSVTDGKEFEDVVRLDCNSDHNPDIVHDLTVHPLPFSDNMFDEIHAYDVLEHLAYQGDYKFFFSEFSEYHRILKPGGLFMCSVPSKDSVWCWGDPSHKRVIQKESLVFLSQKQYEQQVGKTQMSDFRNIYKADFDTIFIKESNEKLYFILRSVK